MSKRLASRYLQNLANIKQKEEEDLIKERDKRATKRAAGLADRVSDEPKAPRVATKELSCTASTQAPIRIKENVKKILLNKRMEQSSAIAEGRKSVWELLQQHRGSLIQSNGSSADGETFDECLSEDIWLMLPYELWILICSHLDTVSLLACGVVCSELYRLTCAYELWKPCCKEVFPDSPLFREDPTDGAVWKESVVSNLRAMALVIKYSSHVEKTEFESKLPRKNSIVKSIPTTVTHAIHHGKTLEKTRLLVAQGDNDGSILIWNFPLDLNRYAQDLKDKKRTNVAPHRAFSIGHHGSPISALCLAPQLSFLLSASGETVHITDLKSRMSVRTLLHSRKVMALHVWHNHAVSLTKDCFLRVWDIGSGDCLLEHCLDENGRLLDAKFSSDIMCIVESKVTYVIDLSKLLQSTDDGGITVDVDYEAVVAKTLGKSYVLIDSSEPDVLTLYLSGEGCMRLFFSIMEHTLWMAPNSNDQNIGTLHKWAIPRGSLLLSPYSLSYISGERRTLLKEHSYGSSFIGQTYDVPITFLDNNSYVSIFVSQESSTVLHFHFNSRESQQDTLQAGHQYALLKSAEAQLSKQSSYRFRIYECDTE